MAPPRPRVPRYGSAAVDAVLPDMLAALGGGGSPVLGLPAGLTGAVVLVVDGLGARQLEEHADVAPFLSGAPGTTLDAPFPTTTTTGLTSLGTGRAPGEHGLVGYAVGVEDDDRPLTLLSWTWGRADLGVDAREAVVPEVFQPHATVFERAAVDGVAAVTVLRPEFVASGLTRAGLRGGEVITAVGLEHSLEAALGAATRPGRTLVYLHHGDLDTVGHTSGPGSAPWRSELAAVDAVIEDAAVRLPGDVVLVVTADHGMVWISDGGFVELADEPSLATGVRVLAGEPRTRQLHTVSGAADDVRTAWQDRFGDVAVVRTRDELIDAGWFGPRVAPRVRSRIGDVVVSATVDDVSWVHRDLDPSGGRLRGQHGALTAAEVEVPALVLVDTTW